MNEVSRKILVSPPPKYELAAVDRAYTGWLKKPCRETAEQLSKNADVLLKCGDDHFTVYLPEQNGNGAPLWLINCFHIKFLAALLALKLDYDAESIRLSAMLGNHFRALHTSHEVLARAIQREGGRRGGSAFRGLREETRRRGYDSEVRARLVAEGQILKANGLSQRNRARVLANRNKGIPYDTILTWLKKMGG